jgi:F-type H+-transporting ATPase subunit epsilon
MSLNVRVITPDKIVWDAEVDEVVLPSATGRVGVLKDHAPLLTALEIGVLRMRVATKWNKIILIEGFAEVEDNNVIVLCNETEDANSIDLKTAQENLEKLTSLFDQAPTKKEKIAATLDLKKARARFMSLTD